MRCEQVREWISDEIDGVLEPDRRVRLEEHLATCPDCRRERDELARTVALVRGLDRVEPPAGLLERVHERLERAEPRKGIWLLFCQPPARVAIAAGLLLVVGLFAFREMLGTSGPSVLEDRAVTGPVATAPAIPPRAPAKTGTEARDKYEADRASVVRNEAEAPQKESGALPGAVREDQLAAAKEASPTARDAAPAERAAAKAGFAEGGAGDGRSRPDTPKRAKSGRPAAKSALASGEANQIQAPAPRPVAVAEGKVGQDEAVDRVAGEQELSGQTRSGWGQGDVPTTPGLYARDPAADPAVPVAAPAPVLAGLTAKRSVSAPAVSAPAAAPPAAPGTMMGEEIQVARQTGGGKETENRPPDEKGAGGAFTVTIAMMAPDVNAVERVLMESAGVVRGSRAAKSAAVGHDTLVPETRRQKQGARTFEVSVMSGDYRRLLARLETVGRILPATDEQHPGQAAAISIQADAKSAAPAAEPAEDLVTVVITVQPGSPGE